MATGVLPVAGLVVLFVWPAGWVIAVLLITVAVALRFRDLRRGRLRSAPWPLAIIAMIMPRPAAHSYLEELGHSAIELRGAERRWHVWHAIKAMPGTLVTVWQGWLRERSVRSAVWILADRVRRVQLRIEDPTVGPRQFSAALRRLGWYCRLVLCATGRVQYHEYSDPARALLADCRRSAGVNGGAESAVRIRQGVKKLADVLANRRSGRV